MGIFDAPAWIFAWVDGRADTLMPAVVRIALWGVLAGIGSMLLYRGLSAQDRIRRGKTALREARRRLDAFDGDFSDAIPLIRKMLRISFIQVGRVGWPALVATLPVLCLLSWLSTGFAYRYPPPGVTPGIHVEPSSLQAKWIPGDGAGAPPHILVSSGDGAVLAMVALSAPLPVVAKRQWWNIFVGDPNGYLADGKGIDRIEVALPARRYLPFGPAWMGGWEAVFFSGLVAATLLFRMVVHVE